MINLNIRNGVEDLSALHSRKGRTAFIVGVCRGYDELDKWRPYFEELKKISNIFFVRHPDQIDYLRHYGIEAFFIPNNEISYTGNIQYRPNHILYTGFFWYEKDITMFVNVARILQQWNFTIHIGMERATDQSIFPPNIEFNGKFMQANEYRNYLPSFEYIWIPRKRTDSIYSGRSGITAVASGRPTILTDVKTNSVIPDDSAIKYPSYWNAEQIAELISSRPQPNPESVSKFLLSVNPQIVWDFIMQIINKHYDNS